MNRLTSITLLVVFLLLVSCAAPTTTPSPTIEPSPTRTPTATSTPTITPTPTPTLPPLAVDTDHPVVTSDGPEGALYRLGMGWDDLAAVSPDSRLLALPASTGLYIYTADILEPVWANTDKSYVGRAIWSPDGSLVIGLHYDETISVFAADDGSLLHQFPVEMDANYITSSTSIGVSADNRLLFIEKRLYDIASGEELACVGCEHDMTDVSNYDARLAFTDDSILRAAYPCEEAGFCLWQSDTEQATPYPLAGAFEFGPLSISPDGNWVLVRADNSVRLFDVQTETYNRLVELTNIPFDEHSFYNPDNITWAPDSSAFIVRPEGHKQTYLFQTGTETSLLSWPEWSYVFWSPDSSTMMRTAEEVVSLYTVSSGELILEMEYIGSGVVALLDNGSILWRCHFCNSYRSLGVSTGSEDEFSHTLNTDIDIFNLTSAGWTQDNLLLVISDKSEFLFFDGALGEHVATVETGMIALIPSHHDYQWSADGNRLVWQAEGAGLGEDTEWDENWILGNAILWNRKTGELSMPFDIGGYSTNSIALSPDGEQLLIGSTIHSTIFLFDVETGEKLNEINEDDYSASDVVDLAWSPDGSQFASLDGGSIDPIIIWDAETFTPEYTLMPDWDERTSFRTINWVGDLIAAAGWNNIHVWQASTQNLLWSDSLDAGALDITDRCTVTGIDLDNRMAVSPDGRYLAMVVNGGAEGCDPIAVYDAHTGELLHTYPGNGTSGISRIVWSPDGQYLATVAVQDTIVVWDTSLLPPIELP